MNSPIIYMNIDINGRLRDITGLKNGLPWNLIRIIQAGMLRSVSQRLYILSNLLMARHSKDVSMIFYRPVKEAGRDE